MANTVAIDVKINALEAAQSLKELNQGIKDARNQLAGLEVGSAEFNKLAGAIDDAKDRVEEINRGVEQVGLAGKFSAIAKAGAGIAAGFEVAQGAMALFGAEGKEVEEAMKKVQAAMALAQGLSEISEMGKAFGDLKNIAVGAFNAIKTSITSTGIGAAVVAIGLALAVLMTYWDDIKEAISGVSEEQKQLLENSKQQVALESKKLQIIKDTENILKMQGKTEKEILQMKIKAIDATLQAGLIESQNTVARLKGQIETEKKWHTFLDWYLTICAEGIIWPFRTVAGIVDLTILQWNMLAGALGKDSLKITTLNEQITKLRQTASEKVTSLIFDPKKTAEDGLKEIKSLEDTQRKLLNEKAGFQNSIKDIDKKAADDAKKKAEDSAKLQEELNKELAKLRIDNLDEQRKADKEKENLDYQNTKKDYEIKYKGLKNLNQLLEELRLNHQNKLSEIDNKYNIERDKKERERQQKEIDLKIEGINNERKAIENDRKLTYEEQISFENRIYEASISNTKLTILEKQKLELEHKGKLKTLNDSFQAELKAKQDKYNADELSILDTKIKTAQRLKQNTDQMEIDAAKLKNEKIQKDLNKSYAEKLAAQEEYDAKVAEIDKRDRERKESAIMGTLNVTKSGLQATADLVSAFAGKSKDAQKKAFEFQKGINIATATIDTFQSAVAAYKSALLVPIVGNVLAPIAAGVAVAAGIANIRKIEQTKFDSKETPSGSAGGGGGSFAPNLSAPVGNTSTNLASIGFGGQEQPEPVKVFVTETDISSSQKNIQKIEQKASIE